MSQDNGGPAFPQSSVIHPQGMTLRDYFAAKAMQAIVGKYPATEMDESAARAEMADFAFSAYAIADAMLKARQQ